MNFLCPVCGYGGLTHAPTDYTICPSCGTEFGYNDYAISHETLRASWIAQGAPWFSRARPSPPDWNPFLQLLKAGLIRKLTADDCGVRTIDTVLDVTIQPDRMHVTFISTTATTLKVAA